VRWKDSSGASIAIGSSNVIQLDEKTKSHEEHHGVPQKVTYCPKPVGAGSM
jgi:hypothetical protein